MIHMGDASSSYRRMQNPPVWLDPLMVAAKDLHSGINNFLRNGQVLPKPQRKKLAYEDDAS